MKWWAVVFFRDGKWLATASNDGVPTIRDARTGHRLARLRGHKDSTWCLAISRDGKLLASGSDDATVRVCAAPQR